MRPAVTIDHLQIVLPPGFEGRADSIARRVAHELSRLPVAESARLDTLAVPPVTVHPGHDDGHVAAHIARAIAGAITSARGGVGC